ncbi:MAG TPA: RagB/SusD family nutrient uptake outer membrane protein [Gemmatimonas aurantiaca]|uniref:RagB/SusD family nutrient uptake outer membrane protein n=2 Tax=Gemmatimonas aurantiaca TaxID=173480 RepID=C1A6A3_GEMAT|nr:RagB/SusD family nutrient uptake outer membrane protein [Gemmatimonas aurantiaca]BAH37763.1 hypothetical protein GAU_0721 [Gemmatimonas aurantiaca T-27]HCT58796.1 RagB/SusD family nutrient uptake outer membrane protein [Gemmatimonas aurantiaca]
MRKHISTLVTGGTLLGLAACGDNLAVTNLNNPDVQRAYSTPAGIEGVIAGIGVQVFNAQRATESVNTQARILSGENIASVANFGMAARSALPRSIISNELGNDNQVGNIANFNTFTRQSRSASNGVAAVNRLVASGGTIGSTAQNARAKAFGFLMLGHALGNLALAYDSAAIVTPATPSEEVPGLSAAPAVGAASLAMLDSAIAQARLTVTGSNGFPLPTTWLNGQALSADGFIRYARSLKARYRAGVARTPAQRGSVAWAEVIADATNGITADFTINVGGGSGWTAAYDMTQMYVTGGWHAVPYFYYGMADVSGAYDAWLAVDVGSRRAFTVVTPDKRWPAGDTRTAQQAAGPTNTLPTGVYFRNRPTGDDVPLVGPGDSQYDHRRYGASNLNNSTGPYTEMSKTEIDMLAAEGYIRTGNIPAAVALINVTRVKNGLEAIPTNISATAPISTSASCVPRVPQGPNFTSTACGTVLEAMKYEKRMETAYTGYMIWFADNRGWGDLVTGTVVEWPVPYQEMQVRQQKYYNGTNRSVRGTYGF